MELSNREVIKSIGLSDQAIRQLPERDVAKLATFIKKTNNIIDDERKNKDIIENEHY